MEFEDAAIPIVAVALCALIALRMWTRHRRDESLRKRRFDMQMRLLDKAGSGAELRSFLASDEGRRIFEHVAEDEASVLEDTMHWITSTMLWGMIMVFVGMGCFVAAGLGRDEDFFVPGALALFVGIGLLIGARYSYRLSSKWGLIKDEKSPTSESGTS